MSDTGICSSCGGFGEVDSSHLKEDDSWEYRRVSCPYCSGKGFQNIRDTAAVRVNQEKVLEAVMNALANYKPIKR